MIDPALRAELAQKIAARLFNRSAWSDEEVEFAVDMALDVIDAGPYRVTWQPEEEQ